MKFSRFRSLVGLALGATLIVTAPVSLEFASASTWTGGTGNWSSVVTPGWTTGGVPNSPGAIADNPISATGTTTVDVSNRTVGTISLSGGGGFEWTISPSTNGITLNQDGGGAGRATISNANTSTTNRLILSGGTLTLADDLLVENTGNSDLTGTNNGSILITSVMAGSGDVTFRNNAPTYPSDLTNQNYRGAILIFNGTGTGAGTVGSTPSTYVGDVSVEKGLVLYQNIRSFGDPANVITVGKAGEGDAALMMTGIAPAGAATIPYNMVIKPSGGIVTIGTLSGSTSSLPTFSGTILLEGNVRIAGGNGTNTTGSTYSGVISGDGGVELTIATTDSMSGYVRFQGANTYAGNTVISKGVFVADNAGGNAIPDGPGKGNVSVANGATLRVNVDETINGLSGVAGAIVNNRSSSARQLTIGNNNQDGDYAGLIQNGGTGAFSITKIGTGTLVLSGTGADADTYTGTTNVENGTLLVNGAHSGGGAYTVGLAANPNAATLGGMGTISLASNASVTVTADGNLSPGASIGTLTFTFAGTGGLDLSATTDNSGALKFELAAPGVGDMVVLTAGGAGLNIGTLDFADFTFTTSGGFGAGTFTLFQTEATILGSIGTANGNIAGYLAELSLVDGNASLSNVLLTVTAIPEAGSFLMLGVVALCSLTGVAVRKRNRFRGTPQLGSMEV